MKTKILYHVILLLGLIQAQTTSAQILLPIEDPPGTNVTEIDPAFTCMSPYENVPIARQNGKTWRFEKDAWPADLFWGPDTTIMDLITASDPLCNNLQDVLLDTMASDLEGGIAVFIGLTTYPVIGTTPVRFTMTCQSYPDSLPISLTLNPAGFILVPVTENFEVNFLIEAMVEAGDPSVQRNTDDICLPAGIIPSGWYPALDLFDQIGCAGNSCKSSTDLICTHFERPSFFVLCTNAETPALSAENDTICPNSTATISIEGSLMSATHWIIYDDSCGGDSIGMTTTSTFITGELAKSDTFYIRGSGGCVTPGECASIIITVQDTTPPMLTLIGDNPFTVPCEGNYVDPGVMAIDDCDGDLSPKVEVDNPVNSESPGEYIVTYTSTDASGNTDSIKRTVIVQEPIECTVCKDTLVVTAGYLANDPHLSTFHAGSVLQSDGIVTLGENLIFKAGVSVDLLHLFEVATGASLEIFIEECVVENNATKRPFSEVLSEEKVDTKNRPRRQGH